MGFVFVVVSTAASVVVALSVVVSVVGVSVVTSCVDVAVVVSVVISVVGEAVVWQAAVLVCSGKSAYRKISCVDLKKKRLCCN